MKKHYVLMCFGLLLSLAVTAQSQQIKSPSFEFDSLNVTYEGSWGFGQSFSVQSNSSGTIEFVGSGAGVIILDVSTPANPIKISEFSTRGLVDAIYFDEITNRLYVTAYFAGFEIWDVSNMSEPVKIGGGQVIGLPRGGIYADGNYVYIVTVADGVQIFEVSEPSSPVYLGSCELDPNNFAWNSAKSGNLIFAALSEGGMKVVDITDPNNPFIAGTYSDLVYGVSVSDQLAYVVSYNFGLNILDISNLSNITVTGTCAVPGFPYRVKVLGDYAFVGNTDSQAGGINVVNVSNPANPSLSATYPGYAEHIAAAGNTLAFTGSSMACTILDISTPTTPVLANSYSLPHFTGDIYVEGNYAYTGNNGFRVFDISNESNPVQVGYNSIDGSIVRTAGNKAVYIRESMTNNNPVMVMDITDPTNPTLIGQYNSPVMTNDLEVKDNYAFVSCWWDGIRIVDFEDPSNPVLSVHTMGWTAGGTPGVTFFYSQALDVEGNYLYAIDYGPFEGEDTKGLYIMDITDILNPVLVTRFTGFTSYGYDIDVVGDFVYIADNYGGMEIIDVTDKNNPIARGYISLPDGANSVKVTEDHAFVADYINGGVQVIDVSIPDEPTIAGYYARTGCFALAVDVEGRNIYVADGAGGFQIYYTPLITSSYNNTTASETTVISWPNPFNNEIVIKVKNAPISDKWITVYDVSGNKVVMLFPVEYKAGEAVYNWNGKYSSGATAGAGLYFYRSTSGKISGKVINTLSQYTFVFCIKKRHNLCVSF